MSDIIHVCPDCAGDNGDACCNYNKCEAAKGETVITSCIHCYGELLEVDGKWYHHSQFDENNNLISPDMYQDIVW